MVARLQTQSQTQEYQGCVKAATLFIYLDCYYLFGCLFVFIIVCFVAFLHFTLHLCHLLSHTQSFSVPTACQRACLVITGVPSLVSNFAKRTHADVLIDSDLSCFSAINIFLQKTLYPLAFQINVGFVFTCK